MSKRIEEMISVPKSWYLTMKLYGLTPNKVRDHNIGESNYSEMGIQPWSYQIANPNLTPIEFDIIGYLTRNKEGESRLKTYRKVLHCMEELVRQEEVKEEIERYNDWMNTDLDAEEIRVG